MTLAPAPHPAAKDGSLPLGLYRVVHSRRCLGYLDDMTATMSACS